MEEIKKLVQNQEYMKAVALQQGFLRATYQQILTEDNSLEKRKFVRATINILKEKLEKEYGQTLFDEEADNKLYKE